MRAAYPLKSLTHLPLAQRHGLSTAPPAREVLQVAARHIEDAEWPVALVSVSQSEESVEAILPVPECRCAFGTASSSFHPELLVGRLSGLIQGVIVRQAPGGMYEAQTKSSCDPVVLGAQAAPVGGACFRTTRREAELVALCEAAERYCGSVMPRILTPATLDEVPEPFIAPSRLRPLAEREGSGAHAGIDRHSKLAWVTAQRLQDGRYGLVPAAAVYAPYPFDNEPRWLHPITTGLAAGSCPQEAAWRGLLEVIERDAWALTWEQKLPSTALMPCCESVQKVLNGTTQGSSTVEMRLLPTDHGIPVVLARSTEDTGQECIACFGTKAGVTLHDAMAGALAELAQSRVYVRTLLIRRPPPGRIRDVRRMEDHYTFYCQRERHHHLDFLRDGPSQPPGGCDRDDGLLPHLKKLDRIVTALESVYLEPWVVDVTTADIQLAGIHVVRALVPDMIPICYGRCCCHEMPRIFNAPISMGFTPRTVPADPETRAPRPGS